MSGVSKESHFQDKGLLTPEEFVTAGDQLSKSCPAWIWKSAISEQKTSKHLPKNKQFLVTQATSRKRVPKTSAKSNVKTTLFYQILIHNFFKFLFVNIVNITQSIPLNLLLAIYHHKYI